MSKREADDEGSELGGIRILYNLSEFVVGIDSFLGEARRASADLHDFAVLDPDVAVKARNARPVDDRAALDVEIIISHYEFPPRW